MKRYIYITLLVFASLFCQAFGAQYEPPTILDTTICTEPGSTVHMSNFKPRILELLQNREDSIWSDCCDVTVELEENPQIAIDSKPTTGWPKLDIDKNMVVGMTVTYKRQLKCTNLPRSKEDAKTPASYAMWHIFGHLLSETETGKVTKISDEATVTTLHKVKFVFDFKLAFPNDILFEIINEDAEDFCLEDNLIWLKVPDEYSSCHLEWEIPYGIVFRKGNDTQSAVTLKRVTEDYAYPIVCRATSCSGNIVSDTKIIGIQTPTPKVDDLACIAANDTSFEVNVNNPNPQLFYHWTLEDLGNGTIVDTKQGASVTMAIPQNKSVRLNLRSSGGCKDAEMEPVILHRSLVSEAHHIEMEAESHCIFAGDTLRLSLSETPEDILVWQIAGNTTMLPPHDIYNYPTVQEKENVIVSVYAKACPNDIITETFNIREDFRVSLGTSPMCISANEYQVIKLTSNGVNPEVHWYGNGVEIDSSTYKKEDSIRLKLTNPGDPNLYVKVTAKECDRERDTLVVLHPKPEKPSLDPLLGMLTPCIPLGMADTIELRVQPQDGVKFKWKFSDNEKFRRIAESDSHSIRVVTNFGLLDSEDDKTIGINIYAYTEGCSDTLDKQETLYATGAGLGAEWHLLQENFLDMLYIVGFTDNDVLEDDGFADPFNGIYSFDWHSDYVYIDNPSEYNYILFLDYDHPSFPFPISCKLTSEENCYSMYSIDVVDMSEQQDVLFAAKKGREEVGKGRETEALQAQVSFEKEDMPCPGIVLKPNPVRSGVQVKVEGICETESFIVECYSPQGRLLFRTTAKGDTFTLPTDNYAAGVYIVKIQWSGAAALVVKKLIIL